MAQKFPEWTARELGERGDFSAYGGESYGAIQVRLQKFVSRFPHAEYVDRDIVVVSHGGAIYQLMKLWCGWPVPRHFFTRIENCTCFCLRLRVVSGHECAELQSMIPLDLMGSP